MGLRGRIEASRFGRLIWPGGRNRGGNKVRRNLATLWLADAVRAIRGKEPRDALPRSMNAPRANRLAAKLWGGFSAPALEELEALCRSGAATKIERRAAAWYIAEWYHFRKDARTTLSWLEFTNRLDRRWRLDKPNLLLQVDAHLELGNFLAAERIIADGIGRHGYDIDLCLLLSNSIRAKAAAEEVPGADQLRIDFINRIYAAAGLHPIRKINPRRSLSLDNVTSAAPAAAQPPVGGPMISVIVPAYNAEETIGFALSGLLEQSWRNIEVIVVDDGSTDKTGEIVERAAAGDLRIKLIASERNAGPYAARNLGVRHARGEFLTVHDADDWSHSQKLEVQIKSLLEAGAVANMSAWIRVTMDLQVGHLWRARNRFAQANHSSLMLRKETMADLGGWDPVKYHADNEFVRRLVRKYGDKRIRWMSRMPLSFGLMRADSLTGSDATHINSLMFGSRMEYRRAFNRWHASALVSGDFRLDPAPGTPRRFRAPAPMIAGGPACIRYDVIFAGDIALPTEALASLYRDIIGTLEAGLRIGVFHWPRYGLDADREIDARLAQMIDDSRIDAIVADQRVATNELIFFDPAGLQHRLDRVPDISYEHIYVIADEKKAGGGRAVFDTLAAKGTLEGLFGSCGEWRSAMPSRDVATATTGEARQ